MNTGLTSNHAAAESARMRRADREALWTILGVKSGTGRQAGSANADTMSLGVAKPFTVSTDGVSGTALRPLARLLALTQAELGMAVGLSRESCTRDIRTEQELPTEAAARVLRLVELEARTTEVMASEEAALCWMKADHPTLGMSPLRAVEAEEGFQKVLDVLAAIEFGFPA